MKLSEKALKKILDSKSLPGLIRASIGVSRVTMWKYLKENSDELTKAAALEVIRKETGMTDDEILVRELQGAA